MYDLTYRNLERKIQIEIQIETIIAKHLKFVNY